MKFRKKSMLLVCTIVIALAMMLTMSGCAPSASTTQRQALYDEIDQAISRNDFAGGLQQLILAQGLQRPLYNENNAISLYLDKGLLEFFAGIHDDSANSLLNAERLIQDAYTKSISQSVATYILNDNSREYPGEDFEDIYLSVFNALNFFNQGNTEGALVEIRKLTLPSGKLELLSRKYDDGNARIGSEDDRLSDAEKRTTTFSNSALARFLSVLFYQADGNYDAVRIELEQLRYAFASQSGIYKQPLPSAIEVIERHEPGTARLDILSFVGLSPIKEERLYTQYFPFFSEPALRNPQFSLPALVDRPNRIDRIEIVVGDERFNLELLEDMGAVIVDTFNARWTNIFLKTYLRTLTKYTAAELSINEIRKLYGSRAGVATSLVLRGLVDGSERADVRMSRFLPSKVYIGSINIDPGTYTVTANFYSGSERVGTKTEEDIVVGERTLNLAQFVNLDFIYAYGGK